MSAFRVEHDFLGQIQVPAVAYYGCQTARAVANFPVSGITLARFPSLLRALAVVKKSCALANFQLGRLSSEKFAAITTAADEVVEGNHWDHFPLDMIQGGAGTSTNMNMNEVLANRGLEMLGKERGDYDFLHPNDDVNACQSTNDVYPTSVRLGILFEIAKLRGALERLADAFERLADAFEERARANASIWKIGRTQLQDAVPMTLGQELAAFAATLREDVQRLVDIRPLLLEVNLGGTAIGTGVNADPSFGDRAIAHLSRLTSFEFRRSADLIEASWDMGCFVMFSGLLKRIACKLSKIANDLRLLSSGPRGWFDEITLPAVQPGSSIMPGKVNPVIPEMINQICFQVIGNDLAITMAAEAGQLQLNAFEPLITFNILTSMQYLENGIDVFATRCVGGVVGRPEQCAVHLRNSTGGATALLPLVGYERASQIAKRAIQSGRSVEAVAREELNEQQFASYASAAGERP